MMPVYLLAAVLHELGHAAAIGLLGGSIERLRLYAAGAVLIQRRELSCVKSCAAALAGPLAGLAAAVFFAVMNEPLLSGANLLLSAMNLLPILPLDGGVAAEQLLFYLPVDAAVTAERCFRYFSLWASAALTLFSGALLYHTGGNAAFTAVGICLLTHNFKALRT